MELPPPAVPPIGPRKRGPGRNLSASARADLVQQVNVEGKTASEVARTSGLHLSTVCRIAGSARGVATYVGKTDRTTPKVDYPMPPSPFPVDPPPDLRGKRLSVEEKFYLACLVNIQRMSYARVGAQYKLPETTIRHFAQKAVAGKPLDGHGHPPAALDGESDAALRTLATLEGAARPSRKEMRARILSEVAKTRERRGTAGVAERAPGEIANGGGPGDGDIELPPVDASIRTAGAKPLLSRTTWARYLTRYGF